MTMVTKEMTMGEILNIDMSIAYILMDAGMHCVGCPSSVGESLQDACAAHGIDVDTLLKKINEHLDSKK